MAGEDSHEIIRRQAEQVDQFQKRSEQLERQQRKLCRASQPQEPKGPPEDRRSPRGGRCVHGHRSSCPREKGLRRRRFRTHYLHRLRVWRRVGRTNVVSPYTGAVPDWRPPSRPCITRSVSFSAAMARHCCLPSEFAAHERGTAHSDWERLPWRAGL